ncbi:MAG TPA: hypothetical protein PK728_09895 [Bacillota bacterium]|nr:hypothetical protein [Bacillota bacterium]
MEELLKQILGKLESVFQNQSALQKEITVISDKIISLETGQQSIRNSQIRLEHELTDKIRALFDDREVNYDYFESLKEGQARLEEAVEDILDCLKKMEARQMSQEREIRLLRTGKTR